MAGLAKRAAERRAGWRRLQESRSIESRYRVRMPFIEPTPERIQAVRDLEGVEGPIWMLNLLRFKEGGQEMYGRYGATVLPMVEKRGGKLLLSAQGHQTVIGADDEEWDLVAVVMYPDRKTFFEMIMSEEYQAIAHLRTGALADSRLVLMTEQAGF